MEQHGLSTVLDRNETLILDKLSMMDKIIEEACREARDYLAFDQCVLSSINNLNSFIFNSDHRGCVDL